MASIQELFNLPDCAIELTQKGQSLDIIDDSDASEYVDLLVPDIEENSISYKEYLQELRVSKPRIDHFKRGRYSKIINLFIKNLNLFKKNIERKNNKQLMKKLKNSKKVRKQIVRLKQDVNKPDFGRE